MDSHDARTSLWGSCGVRGGGGASISGLRFLSDCLWDHSFSFLFSQSHDISFISQSDHSIYQCDRQTVSRVVLSCFYLTSDSFWRSRLSFSKDLWAEQTVYWHEMNSTPNSLLPLQENHNRKHKWVNWGIFKGKEKQTRLVKQTGVVRRRWDGFRAKLAALFLGRSNRLVFLLWAVLSTCLLFLMSCSNLFVTKDILLIFLHLLRQLSANIIVVYDIKICCNQQTK